MKNTIKRFSSLLIAMLFVFCFVFTSNLTVNAETNGEIVVLYTNDVHSAINDYSVLAAYRAELIAQGFDVITVDAGDAIQGEMIGSLTEGASVVDIMNEVGYDYAVPGNHEFDYKVERLLEISSNEANYEYICANFKDLLNGKDVFAPYAIKEFGDEKIAFIGIASPETYSKSTPAYFQDENGNFIYSFLEDDFYSVIQTAVDNARSEGATKVIVVGHLGISGVTEGWRSIDVIENTTGIDALIDGHAHEVIESRVCKNAYGEDVMLTSTGTKFANFGMLTVSSDGSIKTQLVNPDTVTIDELSDDAKSAYNTIKTKIDAYNAEFEYLFEELGASEVKLVLNDADGNRLVRKAETNLGDFVTDAYKAVTGADIAFVNGGGLRAEINQGVINRKAIMDVNPWNNEMCVIEVSGQQIVDALEYGVSAVPEELGSFPHVAGIAFEVHTYIETPVVTDKLGDFVSIKDGAPRRVKNVYVSGEAIDLDKTYTLAGTRYMLQESGYKMFSDAKTIDYVGPKTDAEMLIEYYINHLDQTITSEQYGNPLGDGRILMINEKPNQPDETAPNAGDDSLQILWISLVVITSVFGVALSKRDYLM